MTQQTTFNQKEVINLALEELSLIGSSNTVTPEEELTVLKWTRIIGFNQAVITCGIIYPEGRGQPFSVNQWAKALGDKLRVLWENHKTKQA